LLEFNLNKYQAKFEKKEVNDKFVQQRVNLVPNNFRTLICKIYAKPSKENIKLARQSINIDLEKSLR